MPYITTYADILNTGDLPSTILEAELDLHRPAAQSRLISWVGQEAYNDAGEETPTDPTRAKILKQAEALLVLHYALPTIGIRIASPEHAMVRRTLAEVTGTSVNETWFASPEDIKVIRQAWLNDASQMCNVYRLEKRPAIFGGIAKVK